MIDQKKSSKLGVILSAFAIGIACIAYVYALIKGETNWSNGIILFCAIAIFFSNIAIYQSLKLKDSKSDKRIQ